MITLIEALNYRCLRYVQRPLKPFHVLVGPNASGKTTFLDVIGFLGDLVSKGFDVALSERTSNPEELLFRRQGDKLELAIEARIPDALRQQTSKPALDTIRYEVAIGFNETRHEFEFKSETLLLTNAKDFSPPQRDPGCAQHGVAFLSNFSEQYDYGLLMFDYAGSGREREQQPRELQETLNHEFAGSVWQERAKTIVLSPELEAWLWSNSPHVDDVAGWKNRQPSLRRWLTEQGWLQQGEVKPDKPKEAFQAALREVRTQRSSSLYQQLAEKVSLRQCTDRSFQEFRDILRAWFPTGNHSITPTFP